MNYPISKQSAPHYRWGAGCDGWRLVDTPDLSLIEERVPPGAAEKRHYHERARQFFYVLAGEAQIEVEGTVHTIQAGSGIEVPPGARHQFMNGSSREVTFLVTSVPSTAGDRVELET